jgi:hypothetical protein
MSMLSHDDVFELIWNQICEIDGDGVLVIPNGCGKERFERILKEVEEAMDRDNLHAIARAEKHKVVRA